MQDNEVGGQHVPEVRVASRREVGTPQWGPILRIAHHPGQLPDP